MTVQSFTYHDLVVRNSECFRERPALVTETGEVRSYGALRARVERLGAGLARAGLEPGDRVVVLAQNRAAYFELYLAAARQGVVLYPLNWRLSAEEVARSLERAGPRGIVIERQYATVLPELPPLALAACFDEPPGAPFQAFDELYEADPGEHGPAPVGPDDPFAIISTAAVDVIPRGAVLTHRNLLLSSLQTMALMGLSAEDGNLLALPLFHVAALGGALNMLQCGGQNVIMRAFDAEQAVELIDRHRLTFVSDFPPVLTNLLDAAAGKGSRLESLRIVSGLDAPETIERLHRETGAEFWTGFGQTETAGFVTVQRVKERPGAAGRPGPLFRVQLVDDYDQEVPAGTPGEIVVRGPCVFDGYFAQPEVTVHTFRGGWHHTGDVGRFDEEGYLYYVGRKPEKELIKPGGENVYPAEVETVIMQMDGVRAVCVFGVPDPRWGEGIKAVIETDRTDLDLESVRAFVGERIARFKRPQYVEVTASLPRDDTGAVDREAVKSRWGGEGAGS